MRFLIDNKRVSHAKVIKNLGLGEYKYICADAKRTYQTYKLKSSKYLLGDNVLIVTI